MAKILFFFFGKDRWTKYLLTNFEEPVNTTWGPMFFSVWFGRKGKIKTVTSTLVTETIKFFLMPLS